ncbi:hypothetical protein IAR55_002984 [Kwoniella newhampshirensis]|uniref:Mutanase n=1 Tax=Kwoniella newhampshirensis TaxID=1651941 RepID=A0AAW0YY22_9TREE
MHLSTTLTLGGLLFVLPATLGAATGIDAHPRRSRHVRHGQYARDVDSSSVASVIGAVNALQSGVARELADRSDKVGQALYVDGGAAAITTSTETVYVTQTVTQAFCPTQTAQDGAIQVSAASPSTLTSNGPTSNTFVASSSDPNPIDTFVSTSSTADSASSSDLASSSGPIDTFVSATSDSIQNGPISLTSTSSPVHDAGLITTSASLAAPTSIGSDQGGASTLTPTIPASTPQITETINPSTSSKTKLVFAHFMVGIVSTYQASDWAKDMNLAKSKGIDGFALNIGVDDYSQKQLDLAYSAAEQISGGFDLFISFDFNWYKISQTAEVATMLKRYVDKPNQLKVDGKPFVSSFIGDGFDWSAAASQVGQELYAVPYFQPTADNANNAGLSGLFSWAAWPGQLDNQPVNASMTDSRDQTYLGVTQPAGKTYMAPVSSWFSTHFGPEVSYSKNWVFKSETLWKDRWDEILSMGDQLDFLEIVTWNDYGESHYIGPVDTPHTDDGSSKWSKGLDHTAMLDFAVPYIKAFKAGQKEPIVEQDTLTYWHRPHLRSASCDATDICNAPPTGHDFLSDTVFVATMTKAGGTVKVISGSNAPFTQQVAAGVQMIEIPMGVGKQSFEFTTSGGGSVNGDSSIEVSADCWNGIYNFNYHSGTITTGA